MWGNEKNVHIIECKIYDKTYFMLDQTHMHAFEMQIRWIFYSISGSIRMKFRFSIKLNWNEACAHCSRISFSTSLNLNDFYSICLRTYEGSCVKWSGTLEHGKCEVYQKLQPNQKPTASAFLECLSVNIFLFLASVLMKLMVTELSYVESRTRFHTKIIYF